MTEREFFIEKVAEELPPFERIFRALPMDKLAHTPHPKSKTAEQLLVQMVDEAESFVGFLSTGTTDWSKHSESSEGTEQMTVRFSNALRAANEVAQKMSEEEWESEAVATYKGQEVMKTTRGKMAWMLLFDLVHHRGQLSTYIRPMGGRVPSIYGPSGDDTQTE
jgi:uncharacterized damage-inducible protein DinB